MIVKHEINKSISVCAAESQPLFTYDYGSKPKPYFHPLRTLSGNLLTNFEPTDHLWHRGLWFTIKYINGVNYWEECDEFGRQVTLCPPALTNDNERHVHIRQELEWRGPDDKPVLSEHREVDVRLLDDAAYAIDFATDLHALDQLTLDRTPFTTWGGYTGLVLRGNRNWVETKIQFPDGTITDRPTGNHANWASLSGLFDGGLNLAGGVAFFDIPANPRHPSPWYGATGSGHYLNAAFLFHEPLIVAKDEHLAFKYRVLVYDGLLSVDQLNGRYEEYVKTKSD